MPNIKIDAVTVPVVVAFTAQPGDVLLLVNGVCVGLQHAEPNYPFDKTGRECSYD